MSIVEASSENIKKACQILRSGGLVAFPTETVYGLGADASNASAVAKIFHAKNRPSSNPLIVHTYSLENIFKFADCGLEEIRKRVEKLSVFWPGPLTVILPRSSLLTPAVSVNTNTVALRIPNHPVALQLLQECDLPIAAPSANPSGYISPTTAQHVSSNLPGKVDMILDGGACNIGIESTVVNLLGQQIEILRPGAVTAEQIEQILSEKIQVRPGLASAPADYSPGNLSDHYSPRTPLIFSLNFNPSEYQGKKIGFISFAGGNLLKCQDVVQINLDKSPEDTTNRLYAALHELDSKGLDLIIIDQVDETGLGLAIMDRLKRAVRK